MKALCSLGHHRHMVARRKGEDGGSSLQGQVVWGERAQGDRKEPAITSSKAFPQEQSWKKRKPLKKCPSW